MTERVRRQRATPLPLLTVSVEVTAQVVDGDPDAQDLHAWVASAVAHYHRFRAGHLAVVGSGSAAGGIRQPKVRAIR